MFKQIALLSLVGFGTISCDSSPSDQMPNVEEFAVLGGENALEYEGKPVTSCDLADPNEIVILLRIQSNAMSGYDPDCNADDLYRWVDSVITKGLVLGSTSPLIKEGSTIELMQHQTHVSFPENSGPYDAIFTVRDLDGVWVQGNNNANGFALDITQKNDNESIDFPTNWSVLKSEIQANQANYASECPSSTIVSQKDFEKWAYSDDPGNIKPGCSDPDPEPTCPASGCTDDGDDSYGADIISP